MLFRRSERTRRLPGSPMMGDASLTNPNQNFNSAVLVLELYRIAEVG